MRAKGALQAGELMQDLKTGHLLGAAPNAQFWGQVIGATVGAIVSAFIYQLYTTFVFQMNREFDVICADRCKGLPNPGRLVPSPDGLRLDFHREAGHRKGASSNGQGMGRWRWRTFLRYHHREDSINREALARTDSRRGCSSRRCVSSMKLAFVAQHARLHHNVSRNV